jgi:hypothetical protein
MQAASSSQSSKGVGRQAEHALEHPREMELVAETHLLGHALDQRARLMEQFSRLIHFQAQQILIRALLIITLEQAAQVGGVQVTFPGDLPQCLEPLEIFFNMLAALLIGCE